MMDGSIEPSGTLVPNLPLLRAVASSTRPLYQLLKSISFTNKIHIQIMPDQIRFAADHSRVMQGVAHWNKNLFDTYTTNLPEDEEFPSFQVSLPALLETLQIFGAVDAAARQAKADVDPYRSNLRNYKPDAFSNQTLGMAGTCSLSYADDGEPFSVILEDSGVKTTCNLKTYVPESPEDIPFDKEDLAFKIITQSRWLLDALAEIAPTSPEKLTIIASKEQPYLRLVSSGQHGTSSVDFAKGRDLLETLQVRGRWAQTFKFDMIKSASEAMRIGSKVSIRGDGMGVLSMQFMIEVEGCGNNFLDFRFVPYAVPDDEEDEDADQDDEEEFGDE